MQSEMKLLLESGENLSKILESGGGWFIGYLYFDALLPWVGVASLASLIIYLVYRHDVKCENAARDKLEEYRKIISPRSTSGFTDETHERIKKILKEC